MPSATRWCQVPGVALALLAVAAFAAPSGHLSVASQPGSPMLYLALTGDAWLRQTVSVNLLPGETALSFPHKRLEVALDSLDLHVLSPPEGVEVLGLTPAPDAPDQVTWRLRSDRRCQTLLAISHPLKGIEWSMQYTGVVNPRDQALTVSANVALTNTSKLHLADATLRLPGGHVLSTDIPQNETFELQLYSVSGEPYEQLFVHDLARYGAGVHTVLRMARDRQNPFGQRGVPAGKMRVYGPGPLGPYIGEDALPYLPPREPVNINLGVVPEVTVARRLVKVTQVDVRSDLTRRLVLFHQDDDVELSIRNARPSPIALTIVDSIEGDWSLLRHSAPYTKTDASTVQFDIKLDPGESRKLTYTARRLNIQP